MKWPHLIAFMLLLFLPIAWHWDSDIIPVNDGFGWDGNMYGMYTQYLPEAIEQGAINEFRMQRMLVPASLYHLMAWAGLERTHEEVIQAFRISNLLFILLGVIAFLLLARSRKWFGETVMLGAAAVFFNMPIMKMSLFYPVLADIPSMTIGLWAVLCWQKGWRIGLLVVILIGAFAGPTMWVYGLLLLSDTKGSVVKSLTPGSFYWSLVIPALFIVAWVWVWQTSPGVFTDPPSGSQSVRFNLLPFSFLIVLGYLIWVGQPLRYISGLKSQFRQIQWLWLIPFALIIGLVQWVIQRYAGPEQVPQTLLSYGQLLLQQSVTYPAGFLVGHFAYFPGLVILGILASPYLMHNVPRYGPGAILMTLIVLLMALGSETRQLMQVLPWLIFLIIDSVDRHLRFSPWLLGLIIVCLWCLAPWWVDLAEPGSLDGAFLSDPAQSFFRYQGPWMNQASWWRTLITLVGILLTFALSWRYGLIQEKGKSKLS
ncbi:MAG: hypothetical protein K9I85_01880 [Saprospiraceae bacterium]|nr:hypothetical protein [Saprospiraceae bacterium]